MKFMSQKERNFQPKSGLGGKKSGGGGSGRSRPAKQGTGRKPEGHRGDRSPRAYDRDARPPRCAAKGGERRDKPYKKRESGYSHGGEKRGDNPYKKREFSGDNRKNFGDKKPFDDKKPFNKGNRRGRPQKNYERYNERPSGKRFGENRTSISAETRLKLKSDRPSYGAPSSTYLYGFHSVTEALLNPKRILQRLLCTQNGYESIKETWREAKDNDIRLPEVITMEKEDIDRLLPRDAVHQDILLDCQPLEETLLIDLLLTVKDDAKILVLDQVTDPHNIGAILRSAAAFGAMAVVMQKIHAPEITGTLAKAASGAVEHVPLLREVNLSRALEQLKEAGFFCIGLDEKGKQPLSKLNLTGKTALVLGAEGSGLRRLVAENCDELVKLQTQDPISSLNVSNAAAVALYELIRNAPSKAEETYAKFV